MGSEIEDKVSGWCLDLGELSKGDNPQCSFLYVLKYYGFVYNILQPKGKDFIQVQLSVNVAEEHRKAFSSSDQTNKDNISFLLTSIFLNKSGLQFELCDGRDKLEKWHTIDKIYFDGLTKDRFAKSLRKIGNLNKAAAHTLDRFLGNRGSTATGPEISIYG